MVKLKDHICIWEKSDLIYKQRKKVRQQTQSSTASIPLLRYKRAFPLCAVTLLFFLMTSSFIEARNGFIPHYVGLHGLTGGAGLAFPQDGSGVVTNPAALGMLNNHFMLLAGLLFQDQSVDTTDALIGNPVARKQKNLHTPIPLGTIGFNYRLNPKLAVGLGVSGGGGEVKFKRSITAPDKDYDKEAVNNVVLSVPALAYSPTPNQSYGIGLLVGYSKFRADLANSTGQEIKGRGRADTSYGLGFRLGSIWKVTEDFSLAASVSSPVYFQRHKKYDDLFASPMQIPATALAGIALHLTPEVDFLFDVKQLFYGAASWLRKGQGWRNQTIILTGIQYQPCHDLILGVGYNYGASPINENKVFVNATSLPLEEHNFSGGIRYRFAPNKEFVLIGFVTPANKMTDNGQGPAGFFAKDTKIIMHKTYGGEIGIKVDF